MHHIIKILSILIIELNIYFCLGCAMERIKFLPQIPSFAGKFSCGFLIYHFLFLCLALPCTFLNKSLQLLTICWIVLICALTLWIFLYCRKEIGQTYKNLWLEFWQQRYFLIPCILLQAFLVYYISINGQSDIDARTYIGDVTAMLDLNRLTGFSPTTGQMIDTILLKRSFAMFAANSAVLCDIFQIHPLIFCRTVRASINILLLGAASYEVFKWIYRRHDNQAEHAAMALMIAQSSLFLFTNSIYTSSAFILHRTYEGKAYCSGALILLTAYIALMFCTTKDKRFFLLLFITMMSSMSISASATFLTPLVAGSIILAYIIVKRGWNYIIPLLLSLSPNMIYIIITITGFAGFGLEG